MTKALFTSLTFLLVLAYYANGQSHRTEFLPGTFVAKADSKKKLFFSKDGMFVIIKSIESIFQYTDTLSVGSYKVSGNRILINSMYQEYPDTQSAYARLGVNEIFEKGLDSIHFVLSSALEKQICKDVAPESWPFSYYLNIETVDGQMMNLKVMTNRIEVPAKSIRSFSVEIYPDLRQFTGYLGINSIFSEPYYVSTRESNVFEIEIPVVSLNYISFKRFYDENLIIMKKNQISWQGDIYERVE